MKKHRLLLILGVVPLIIGVTSCSKEKEDERLDGYYGYDASLFTVPSEEGYSSDVYAVMYANDRFYIPVNYQNKDIELYDDMHSVIYCVDKDGQIDYSLQFDHSCYPRFISDNSFVYTSDNNIVFVDIDTGETDHVITFEGEEQLWSLFDLNGRYAITTENAVILCDDEYNEISRITDDDLFIGDIFESEGHYYATRYTYQVEYVELDFDHGTYSTLFDEKDIGADSGTLRDNYIINDDGVFLINPATMTIEQMADWGNTNRIPPSKTGGDYICPVDDLHIAECYSYMDGTCDVVLYTYNSGRDYADAQKIVIGGYNVNSDLSMRWAIYLFNSAHDDYRIVIDDYSDEYGASTGTEFATQTAALIAYFNQGNAPDIFYGDYFDYRSMADMGMLMNLNGDDADQYIKTGDITESVLDAMTFGDDLYVVFPSYYFYGYWGLDSVFGGTADVSYRDLPAYANGISIYGNTWNYNIAYDIIGRDIDELLRLKREGILRDEVKEAVEYAVTYGVAADFPLDMIILPDKVSVAQGQYLMASGVVNDIWFFAGEEIQAGARFDYIGYPSFFGSTHVINARGLTAISADTGHADMCLEFLGYLMSDKVQYVNMHSGQIPVRESIINNMLQYAVDPAGIPEDGTDYLSWASGMEAIPSETAEDLRRAIDSADALSAVDWGLYNIIVDEISSYDYQGRSVDNITDSLTSRLEVYLDENYS